MSQSFNVYCDESCHLANEKCVDEGTLKAKVNNYKSLAGYTSPSNASIATKKFFSQYQHFSVVEVKELIFKLSP